MFFLFLFLELVSFSLIVRNNSFHQASIFNSSNRLVGSVYSWNSSITEYFKTEGSKRESGT